MRDADAGDGDGTADVGVPLHAIIRQYAWPNNSPAAEFGGLAAGSCKGIAVTCASRNTWAARPSPMATRPQRHASCGRQAGAVSWLKSIDSLASCIRPRQWNDDDGGMLPLQRPNQERLPPHNTATSGGTRIPGANGPGRVRPGRSRRNKAADASWSLASSTADQWTNLQRRRCSDAGSI